MNDINQIVNNIKEEITRLKPSRTRIMRVKKELLETLNKEGANIQEFTSNLYSDIDNPSMSSFICSLDLES